MFVMSRVLLLHCHIFKMMNAFGTQHLEVNATVNYSIWENQFPYILASFHFILFMVMWLT